MRRLLKAIAAGALLALAVLGGSAATAEAGQFTSLASPGPLAKAHAQISGTQACTSCHETGRKVTAAKCLSCHKPIADRIARRSGVHRDAGADCTKCHLEHAGPDADLRHFNTAGFDHARETGFPLDGRHAPLAAKCESCHKTRSFLEARTACASCHADQHKGALGAACEKCHSTTALFKEARATFNHATARFQLDGAHVKVECQQCHKTPELRGVAFDTCASCHKDPHEQKFGNTCTKCHTTERWRTQSVDHASTAFPLKGKHADVPCASCHKTGPATTTLVFNTCSACHANIHRDSIKDACETCHNENGFAGAAFDHLARTTFAIDGKHVGLACAKCHTSVSPPEAPFARKVADYSGAARECVSCHGPKDPHKGEFGRACESCHKTDTFDTKAFRHKGDAAFYAGLHTAVACDKCHVPARRPVGTGPSVPLPACASCHVDPHLGQLGTACETCHIVDGEHFDPRLFSHAKTAFALTGKHETIECVACHKSETRVFPAGAGTAKVVKMPEFSCAGCHQDPHMGQVVKTCDTCHATANFKVETFTHKGMDDFFRGFHGKYTCAQCHPKVTSTFPAGQGTTQKFLVGRTCEGCHPK